MEPIDSAVFAGRDPEWREAWEELDAESRGRVTATIKDGSRLDDPVLEPFLYPAVPEPTTPNPGSTAPLRSYWASTTCPPE